MKRLLLLTAFLLFAALPAWTSVARTVDVNSSAWLGVYTQAIDKDLKEAFKLDSDHGVVVSQVVPESPASKAGIKTGDVILSIDGINLTSADQLADVVGKDKPGDKLSIEILRHGVKQNIVATLEERHDNNLSRYFKFDGPGSNPKSYSNMFRFDRSAYSDTYIGVSLQNLNEQLGQYFGVQDGNGALVSEVMDNSPAQEAGLRAGDVIIAINGKEIGDPSDVQESVSGSRVGEKIDVAILRNKSKMEMTVEVAQSPDNLGQLPNAPSRNFILNMPQMKGLMQGNFDNNLPDMQDIQQSIEQLKQEVKDLQKQLEELESDRTR